MRQNPATSCLVHIFVCHNQRPPGGLPSCGASEGQAIIDRLRESATRYGLRSRVWLTSSQCLGLCHKDGVTVAVYPQKHFYQGVTQEDCQELIQKYIEPLCMASRDGGW